MRRDMRYKRSFTHFLYGELSIRRVMTVGCRNVLTSKPRQSVSQSSSHKTRKSAYNATDTSTTPSLLAPSLPASFARSRQFHLDLGMNLPENSSRVEDGQSRRRRAQAISAPNSGMCYAPSTPSHCRQCRRGTAVRVLLNLF